LHQVAGVPLDLSGLRDKLTSQSNATPAGGQG
jgi:hypothetical protein